MNIAIQGAIPAMDPQTNGPQSICSFPELSCSITRPNKFIEAFTKNIRTKDAISYIPNNVAIKTIIIDELIAYSNHLNLFIPFCISLLYISLVLFGSEIIACANADIIKNIETNTPNGN